MAYNDRPEQLERAYRVLGPRAGADLERAYRVLDAQQEQIEAEARRVELVVETLAARVNGYRGPQSLAVPKPRKAKPRHKFTDAQLRIARADYERRRKTA